MSHTSDIPRTNSTKSEVPTDQVKVYIDHKDLVRNFGMESERGARAAGSTSRVATLLSKKQKRILAITLF
jgi:hypothetical protein